MTIGHVINVRELMRVPFSSPELWFSQEKTSGVEIDARANDARNYAQ